MKCSEGFFGSARESVEMYDWRGFSSLSRFDSGSRRRCGNVESRVLCGFPSSEGGRNRCGRKAPSSRPRSVISTARPRFIGHSVENAPFGRPERKWRLSESRLECTILQILAPSRYLNDPRSCQTLYREVRYDTSKAATTRDRTHRYRHGLTARTTSLRARTPEFGRYTR
jgi:hypothetical protein